MKPYTEAANPLTADIDISNSSEIVGKLKLCDEEMFQPANSIHSITVMFRLKLEMIRVINHIS